MDILERIDIITRYGKQSQYEYDLGIKIGKYKDFQEKYPEKFSIGLDDSYFDIIKELKSKGLYIELNRSSMWYLRLYPGKDKITIKVMDKKAREFVKNMLKDDPKFMEKTIKVYKKHVKKSLKDVIDEIKFIENISYDDMFKEIDKLKTEIEIDNYITKVYDYEHKGYIKPRQSKNFFFSLARRRSQIKDKL
jgi:hypothetical protein